MRTDSAEAGSTTGDEGVQRVLARARSARAEYQENPGIVFGSDSKRLESMYRAVEHRRRDWNAVRECWFPECEETSIRRSHTIPRAALSLIAEKGHLLEPYADPSMDALKLRRIGIGVASTFAGFCTEHEAAFQGFEKQVRLEEQWHFILQVFRTVCREIAIKEHQLRRLPTIVDEHRERLDEWLRTKLHEQDAAAQIQYIRSGGGPVEVMEEALLDHRERLVDFKDAFFQPFVEAMQTGNLALSMYHHTLPDRLPVALAGRGNFHVASASGAGAREVLMVINVLPTTRGTTLVLCTPDNGGRGLDDIRSYVHAFLADAGEDEGWLRMVESWMLHGSDHWFLAESAWNSLPQDLRDRIPDVVMDDSIGIGFMPQVPILDAVRVK